MDKSYSFTSDVEPTQAQLDELMRAVLEEVKERATKAESKYKALQAESLVQLFDVWTRKQRNNEG